MIIRDNIHHLFLTLWDCFYKNIQIQISYMKLHWCYMAETLVFNFIPFFFKSSNNIYSASTVTHFAITWLHDQLCQLSYLWLKTLRFSNKRSQNVLVMQNRENSPEWPWTKREKPWLHAEKNSSAPQSWSQKESLLRKDNVP